MEYADNGFAAVESSRSPCVELPESNVIGVRLAVNHRHVPITSANNAWVLLTAYKRRRRGGRRPCQNLERKGKRRKRVLGLPDLEQAKSAVLNTLTSKSGQRTYDRAITEFVEWYCFRTAIGI